MPAGTCTGCTYRRPVFDLEAESARLKTIMDEVGSVNLFLSEGAGLPTIVAELERSGEEVARDPFGHVRIDKINPGEWFASKFAERMGAQKVWCRSRGTSPARRRPTTATSN